MKKVLLACAAIAMLVLLIGCSSKVDDKVDKTDSKAESTKAVSACAELSDKYGVRLVDPDAPLTENFAIGCLRSDMDTLVINNSNAIGLNLENYAGEAPAELISYRFRTGNYYEHKSAGQSMKYPVQAVFYLKGDTVVGAQLVASPAKAEQGLMPGVFPLNDSGVHVGKADISEAPLESAGEFFDASGATQEKDLDDNTPEDVVLKLVEAENKKDWKAVYNLYAEPPVLLDEAVSEWKKIDTIYSNFEVLSTAIRAEGDLALVKVAYEVKETLPNGFRQDSSKKDPGVDWAVVKVGGVWKVRWMPAQ